MQVETTLKLTICSEQLFAEAQALIPGGVNSPVRAFQAVGGVPRFIARAEGARLYDVDGNELIDFVSSWGAILLGHAHPLVTQAVTAAAAKGVSFGAPCQAEITLAQQIQRLMPQIELIRMVNSGTEATMSAIRVARAYTQRDKIIKCSGCYHGHADSFLVKAGSGALTGGQSSSLGVPAAVVADTLVAEYNDLDSFSRLFVQHPDGIAAIIIEPIAGNMNMIPATKDFLSGLRQLCDHYGAVLVFDEVMTGFRVALGGAQAHYGVHADLTTLGKVIGGGLPVGAFGGKKDIMQCVAPLGGAYQAGTLAGNPLAMAAGAAVLSQLDEGVYERLHRLSGQLVDGIIAAGRDHGVEVAGHYQGGMFGLFLGCSAPAQAFAPLSNQQQSLFRAFFHHLLQQGIYVAPSAYEAGFVSMAHTESDIQQMIRVATSFFSTN